MPGCLFLINTDYEYLVIVKCADTAFAPPANGVTVKAVDSPAGLCTLNVELGDTVCIKHVSLINEVPVALPTTVYGTSTELITITNCPASVTLTLNETKYIPTAARLNTLPEIREILEPIIGPS